MSNSTELRLIGGIEGGGTRANVSIINADNSEVLATVHKEGSTNLYHVGVDETCNRLQQLVKDALKNLKSVYGERFCTQTWFQGKASKTLQTLKNKSWDW